MNYLFGERLRRLRKKRGLSQMELANQAALSCNFIGMIERNVQNPSIDSFVRLSEGLEMSVLELTVELLCENRTDECVTLQEDSVQYAVERFNRESVVSEMSTYFFNMKYEDLYSLLRIVKAMNG